jgi:acylpyruvate hydrolase
VRLATIRYSGTTRAVRADGDVAVDLGAADVAEVLRWPDWRARCATTEGRQYAVDGLSFAPVVTAPEKIICVGLNYRSHILEMGRELPRYPTLFAKYSRALVGARDDVILPASSERMDWEAELAVIIGAETRRADAEQAAAVIAGYTVLNDVTARDWQYRTPQWLQGKTFEATTPIGPWLVTADDPAVTIAGLDLACEVDGELMQKANTADLVFHPAALVAYLSTIITLAPGDVIATGTPGGVGHARTPARYLEDGTVLVTRIDGIGECRNVCVREHP